MNADEKFRSKLNEMTMPQLRALALAMGHPPYGASGKRKDTLVSALGDLAKYSAKAKKAARAAFPELR